MISKEQLLTINDLKLSGRVDRMSDKEFGEFCGTLDVFVETLPVREAELKALFGANDNASLSKALFAVRNTLMMIHAEDLAQVCLICLRLLGDGSSAKHDAVEAALTNFLTLLSALSIDIQMVQNKAADQPGMNGGPVKTGGERGGAQGPKSILAVDDVPLILNGLKSILQSTTYKFVGVSSGAAALKYLKEHTPDLFILDIEMPVMNGYELAEQIKKSGQTAPIIFLTGNATKEYVLKAMRTGAVDFIVKPVNREQVLSKIVKYTI